MATIETSEDTKIVIEPSEMQVMENGKICFEIRTNDITVMNNACKWCRQPI